MKPFSPGALKARELAVDVRNEVAARLIVDEALRMKRAQQADRRAIVQCVVDLRREEKAVEAKMARLPVFSGKWWHCVSQLNLLRKQLIDGFEVTDGFDGRISREILFQFEG